MDLQLVFHMSQPVLRSGKVLNAKAPLVKESKE